MSCLSAASGAVITLSSGNAGLIPWDGGGEASEFRVQGPQLHQGLLPTHPHSNLQDPIPS